MIKPTEIHKIANRLEIRDTQIEKDYVIGWLLKGISNNEFLRSKLLFKGGTALRKIYFSDYRLSEDLDFTFNGNDDETVIIRKHFGELIEWLKDEARITLNIQKETLYQTGNYNFFVGYTGPLGGIGANKNIKVDVANDEIICDESKEMIVQNEYSDLQDQFKILSYTLGEIITEKMRSLMQRTMPRDLYDLWYLFEKENESIEDYIFIFEEKAKLKEKNPKEFVKTVIEKEDRFKAGWNNSLVNQFKEVPDFNEVWRTLGKHWRKYNKAINS
jgi:predicted nucleotidyltransferase component of viral defense system